MIELIEQEPLLLPRDALSPAVAEALWQTWGHVVTVEYPSPRTGDQWKLTVGNFAGMLALPEGEQLLIHPRVPVRSLVRLWERVHGLPIGFLGEVADAQTLPAVCEGLATLLSREVERRAHEGWRAQSRERRETTPYVRGRLDARALGRSSTATKPLCAWVERSEDTPLTRLCHWVLHCLGRASWVSESTRALVRAADRTLASVTLTPVTVQDCDALLSARTTTAQDRKLIALCRWVLEGESFAPEQGTAPALGFVVAMERLFERAVTRWLVEHASREWTVQVQPCVPLPPLVESVGDEPFAPFFRPDLVLVERETRRTRCVIDAKYSGEAKPLAREVAQVVAYATALGCRDALLIYPQTLPAHRRVGAVRMRNVMFPLDASWDACGDELLSAVRAGN